MAPANGDGYGSRERCEELSSGSVVFSLPHLRTAIFHHHAQSILRRREKVLGDIPRAMSSSVWDTLSKGPYYSSARYHFKDKLHIIERGTNLLVMLSQLGLQPASWLDLVLQHYTDASAWLITYSHHRKSKVIDLQTHPQCRQGSSNAFEHPGLEPMEMLLYAVTKQFYQRNSMIVGENSTPLWSAFFRDDHGRVYYVSLAHTKHRPFLLEAAQKCPRLLYSPDSPLLPVYDSFSYSGQHEAAVYIGQTPPWPLVQGLVMGVEHQPELRRILERAQDLFAHLVKLEEHGVSLDCEKLGTDWPSSFIYPDRGPWLLSAYLAPSSCASQGRLSRMGHFEETLPEAPLRPWPAPVWKGRQGLSTLPWCQAAAYNDPRVQGPKTYLYGVRSASWTTAAANERRQAWGLYNTPYVSLKLIRDRFQGDLVLMSEDLLSDIFCGCWISPEDCIKVLASQSLSTAYESWLHAPTANLPPPPTCRSHSGLFKACLSCILPDQQQASGSRPTTSAALLSGSCSQRNHWTSANAIPAVLEDLLLRIVQSSVDVTADIVTAREASEIMHHMMEKEIPRCQALYERWADAQQEVPRLTAPLDLRPSSILGDDCVHRWVMLELLRGNYLDEEFRRPELNKMRDHIKNGLSPAQKKLRDKFRVACGDVVAAGNASEQAGDQDESEVAAAPATRAARPAASSSSGAAAVDEAESSSSGAKRGGKRGGGDSSKPAAAKKKSKKAK